MDEQQGTEARTQPSDESSAETTTDTGRAGSTAQANPPTSPQQVLDELSKTQQETEENAKRFTEQSQALKGDIAALEKAQAETDTTATAYGKARPSLEQQRDDLAESINKKREDIERAVGDAKGKVDAAATETENEAKKLETDRQTQWKELVQLVKDRLGAERYLAMARQRFDTEKTRLNTIKERLSRLSELQQELDAAEEAGQSIRKYVVLKEVDRQLQLISDELESVDGYRKDLEAVWAELNTAQGKLRESTHKEAVKQRELEATKDMQARLESKRVDEVLKRVSEIVETSVGTTSSTHAGTRGSSSTSPRSTA